MPQYPAGDCYVLDGSIADIERAPSCPLPSPSEDVQEYGFSAIVDARSSNWHDTKLILRALQVGGSCDCHFPYILVWGYAILYL